MVEKLLLLKEEPQILVRVTLEINLQNSEEWDCNALV